MNYPSLTPKQIFVLLSNMGEFRNTPKEPLMLASVAMSKAMAESFAHYRGRSPKPKSTQGNK